MIGSIRFQGPITAVLVGLAAWASTQLGTTIGLSPRSATALGALLVLILAGVHLRSRRATAELAAKGSAPDAPDLEPRIARFVLVLLVVVAGVLRIHTFLDRPAWADEMWTLRNIYTSDWSELLRVAFDDYWPPLHYVLLNAVARVENTSLLWLRLPSVVFGTATVAVMYPLGFTLFRNRAVALAGTALLAGMTSHVLYSQEARTYAIVVFFAVASAHFFYRSYWERRVSAGFIVSTLLLTYSHSFSAWYFISAEWAYVLLAWILWRDRDAFLKGLLSQSIVLLAWLPLAGAFVYARLAHGIVVPTYWGTGLDKRPGLFDIVEQYQGLAVRSWVGGVFMALMFAIALMPLVKRVTNRPDPAEGSARPMLFLICWVTAPIAFSLGVSVLSSLKTFGEIRYHLAVLPGLCLLAAAALLQVRSAAGRASVWLLLLLLPALQLPRYYVGFHHPAVDKAAKIVRENGSPDEAIYIGGAFRAFAYYYRGVFPRIGSAQWDSLAASTVNLDDRYTTSVKKWGDSYAYEKLPPQIRTFGYYTRTDPDRFLKYVADELRRGGFSGSFWMVLNNPPERRFLEALTRYGVGCSDPKVYYVYGMELRHCISDRPRK